MTKEFQHFNDTNEMKNEQKSDDESIIPQKKGCDGKKNKEKCLLIWFDFIYIWYIFYKYLWLADEFNSRMLIHFCLFWLITFI